VNELEKMVWAAAFAREFAASRVYVTHERATELALAEAERAAASLERYRQSNPTSTWLPEELRS
jgi:hypothetical protein